MVKLRGLEGVPLVGVVFGRWGFLGGGKTIKLINFLTPD